MYLIQSLKARWESDTLTECAIRKLKEKEELNVVKSKAGHPLFSGVGISNVQLIICK